MDFYRFFIFAYEIGENSRCLHLRDQCAIKLGKSNKPSNMQEPTKKINLDQQLPELAGALRADECVLLLGPRAAAFEGTPLEDLLARRLAKKVGRYEEAPTLTQAARWFADAFARPTDALAEAGKLLRHFYEEYAHEDIPVYRIAAEMPFKHVINTNPDGLFLEHLRRVHKSAEQFFDFHFANPQYNKAQNNRAVDLDKNISIDSPLVYNLLGHFDRPDSLVLTDADRLAFLDVVLQREKEATLPANITYFFTRPPLQTMRKAYIFLGFDFNEWHMRLFMHLLRRTHNHLPQSFGVQNRGTLPVETSAFFEQNFSLHFVEDDAETFLSTFKNYLKKSTPAPVPTRMELLLLFHPDDQAQFDRLEKHIAPLKTAGLVDMWHEQKILPGADIQAEITQKMQSARVIVPLLTANFLADERQHPLLDTALRRHEDRSATLVPLWMSPCMADDLPVYDLPTFYPKPKGKPISGRENPEEVLSKFAAELRSIIERSLQSKTKPHVQP